MVHVKNWRVSLHIRNFIIHEIFNEFLQPFRDLRIQRFTLFLLGFLFIWFLEFLLAWSTSGRSDLSSTAIDMCTGEMSLSIRSSRSRVSVSLTVGDEDELEEDVQQ